MPTGTLTTCPCPPTTGGSTTNILVLPDEVVRTARMIDADILRYTDSYTNVYRASDEMRGHWAGKDNQMYNSKLNEYRRVLVEMANLLREYVSFLDRSAVEYRATQDDIWGRAGALPTN